MASLLETQVMNFLRQVDGLRLPAIDRQPLKKEAQILLKSENYSSQQASGFEL
jgi:hypothetical protein